MRRLTVLVCLTFLNALVYSQNIYSALRLNEERDYKTRRPKKIVERNTFYGSSGKHVDRNVKTFDDAGMLLLEERFDEEGKADERLTYTNDTTRRLILSRTFERWTNLGNSIETAFYTYDSNNHLIGTTDKGPKGNIIRQTNLKVNDKGHPIELALFDGNGNRFGGETATYFYDKNKVVTAVVSNQGKILSTDTIKISFRNGNLFSAENETYNSNGDLTNWATRNLDGSQTVYEEEYTYDRFGNCLEDKIYKVTIKANGKRKRGIDRIFKKEYTY